MKSILYKEIGNYWGFFLAMVGTALVSLLVMSGCKVLDSGTGWFLLFALEAPVFLYIITHQSLYGEFQTGTLPFLLSLPLGRSRVWLAKALFAGLFATALYSAFLLIGAAFGLSFLPGPINIADLDRYVIRNSLTVLGIPLLVVAVGMFTTLLWPEGGAILVLVFIGTWAFIGYASRLMLAVNLGLLEILAIFTLLLASWYSFRTGNLFSPWRLALRSVLVLVLCLAAGTLLWSGIDRLAEATCRLEPPDRLYGRLSEDGRFLYTNLPAPAAVWDPIPADTYQRAVELDLTNGNLRPLGRRTTTVRFPTPDGRGLIGWGGWTWPGVGTLEGLAYLDLADPRQETRIESDGQPLFFRRSGELVFARTLDRQGQGIREICRWQPGKETRVVAAYPAQAFRHPRQVALFDALVLSSETEETPSRLFSLEDGSVLPIQLPGQTELAAEGAGWALFRTTGYRSADSRAFFVLDASGTRRDLTGLPGNAEIKGSFPDGRLLIRLESKERTENGNAATTTLSLVRITDEASRTLAIYPDAQVLTHPAPDAGYLVVEAIDRGRSFHLIELNALDLAGDRLAESQRLNLPDRNFQSVICRPDYQAWFYAKSEGIGELWEMDLRTGSSRKRFDLPRR